MMLYGLSKTLKLVTLLSPIVNTVSMLSQRYLINGPAAVYYLQENRVQVNISAYFISYIEQADHYPRGSSDQIHSFFFTKMPVNEATDFIKENTNFYCIISIQHLIITITVFKQLLHNIYDCVILAESITAVTS